MWETGRDTHRKKHIYKDTMTRTNSHIKTHRHTESNKETHALRYTLTHSNKKGGLSDSNRLGN